MSSRAREAIATCSPRHRAALCDALAQAIRGDRLDDDTRAVVAMIDDEVLLFLVRALLRGQLASDGRLFVTTEQLTEFDIDWVMALRPEADDEDLLDPYVGDGGSPATTTSNEPHQ